MTGIHNNDDVKIKLTLQSKEAKTKEIPMIYIVT